MERRPGQRLERHNLARQANLEVACWDLCPAVEHYCCSTVMIIINNHNLFPFLSVPGLFVRQDIAKNFEMRISSLVDLLTRQNETYETEKGLLEVTWLDLSLFTPSRVMLPTPHIFGVAFLNVSTFYIRPLPSLSLLTSLHLDFLIVWPIQLHFFLIWRSIVPSVSWFSSTPFLRSIQQHTFDIWVKIA